ncbi:hypothetical protein FRC04_000372 [Tulasnella sp. 424]|nr:hypothetical protein FRC04_000372 [Tulasnella sp. 424]
MARKRNHGRVSFNPVVAEKRLDDEVSEEEEEEEEVEEGEEEEVAKELEMESGSADEPEQEEPPTLTSQEATALASKFKKMTRAKDTGFNKGDFATRGRSEEDTRPRIAVESEGYRGKEGQDGEGKLCTLAIYADPEFFELTPQVYLEIRWFYSAEQTSALNLPAKAKFRPHLVCGEHELIETTHEDVLSRESFVSRLVVKRLTDDPEQDEINNDDWYTRAFYNLKSKSFTKAGCSNRICKMHYRPESEEAKDEQAYCPHCHEWYHHMCLDESKRHLSQEDHEEDLTKMLARNLPEADDQPAVKRTRTDNRSKSTASPNRRSTQAAELQAKRDLRRIAGTRIVRGGTFGIAGTVKHICTARRILSELEAGVIRRVSSTDWEEEVGTRCQKAI